MYNIQEKGAPTPSDVSEVATHPARGNLSEVTRSNIGWRQAKALAPKYNWELASGAHTFELLQDTVSEVKPGKRFYTYTIPTMTHKAGIKVAFPMTLWETAAWWW